MRTTVQVLHQTRERSSAGSIGVVIYVLSLPGSRAAWFTVSTQRAPDYTPKPCKTSNYYIPTGLRTPQLAHLGLETYTRPTLYRRGEVWRTRLVLLRPRTPQVGRNDGWYGRLIPGVSSPFWFEGGGECCWTKWPHKVECSNVKAGN